MDAVTEATANAAEAGIRVLNAFLLADDEEAHAARLLEFMDPPQGAVVLDAGCGVGELARLMTVARPDLTFRLLNTNEAQLAQCPDGMERIHASFEATGLPDESVDVVMFAFSLCHASDWWAVLREARRVLKEGGYVFLFDMEGPVDNALLWQTLRARVFPGEQVVDLARVAGLETRDVFLHQPLHARLRDVFGSKALYDEALAEVVPITARLYRKTAQNPIVSALHRHQRIAFQFSGGRDSTAALYRLRPHWDRLELYHLDTGEQFPETRRVAGAVMQAFKEATGRDPIVIQGNVAKVREQHGLASDLVPVDNTATGRLVSGREVKLIGRYECCWHSLMQPLHARMKADGITLIVRGQRADEYATPPKMSGDVSDGFEVLYPIEHWTAQKVDAFIEQANLPVADFYAKGVKRAPECMGCTAWWDEGRAGYLRENHPAEHHIYTGRMRTVMAEINRQLSTLET